jgi:hypothetical protein
MALHGYLVGEVTQDFADGLLPRLLVSPGRQALVSR